jgi:hypothetical protein
MTPHLLALLWQVPAIFSAVPMIHRLLPFRLAERAIPLFYVLVSVLVMALPGSLCLALGAAGLVSYLHNQIGVRLSAEAPPDMAEVANKLAVAWDYIVTHLQMLPVNRATPAAYETTVDDDSEDVKEAYQEPPSPPEARVAQRIPHLD